MNTTKIVNHDSPKRVDFDNPKRVHDDYPNYPDKSEDDYESFVETNPCWGRELDSEGEPIYTPEPDDPNHVYNSIDAVFAESDCEKEEWLDILGPFTRLIYFEFCFRFRTYNAFIKLWSRPFERKYSLNGKDLVAATTS
ncbi:uncharacterized protein LOC130825072 isoform X2 [Amaranthus tricolor]|nr:uncharacterized protein LOC130825072 isoform X2 [Amaranthus tricolor]XP_057546087.1 uncharacterized protein LOC130825072 isoform X2 [Amaranthus tricolor]